MSRMRPPAARPLSVLLTLCVSMALAAQRSKRTPMSGADVDAIATFRDIGGPGYTWAPRLSHITRGTSLRSGA